MAVELVVPGKYPAVVILRELMYSLYSAMESFRKKKVRDREDGSERTESVGGLSGGPFPHAPCSSLPIEMLTSVISCKKMV